MVESTTERIERGRAFAKELNEYEGEVSDLLRPVIGVAPDYEGLLLGSVADIWDRDRLSLRERSIIRLALIAALGQAESVTQATIGTALHLGLSREDIAEVFLQTSPQIGLIRVIAVLEALGRHRSP